MPLQSWTTSMTLSITMTKPESMTISDSSSGITTIDLVRCISSFIGGWFVPAANFSKFISGVACFFLMTSTILKIFGCGLPTICFNQECQPST